MKKQYFFNKLVKFFLKADLAPNAEEAALYLFSAEAVNGLWYYLKLVPCEKYGFIPQIGTFTQDEINAYDIKVMNKQKVNLQKMLAPMIQKLDKQALDKKGILDAAQSTDVSWSTIKKPKIIN